MCELYPKAISNRGFCGAYSKGASGTVRGAQYEKPAAGKPVRENGIIRNAAVTPRIHMINECNDDNRSPRRATMMRASAELKASCERGMLLKSVHGGPGSPKQMPHGRDLSAERCSGAERGDTRPIVRLVDEQAQSAREVLARKNGTACPTAEPKAAPGQPRRRCG